MDRIRIQRAVVTTGAVLLLLVLAGTTYQGVATALERRRFPRPGGMVDAGGHQLHLYCVGEGSPTAILEAPAAGMSAAWGWVQPDVARVTRVCSYDRAGLGWSESSDGPYDPHATAGELRTLLANANERAPFVVVGHGIGAAFAKAFASQSGSDVRALVLVDAPDSGRQGDPTWITRYSFALPWLARAGVLRAFDVLSSRTAGLPEPSHSRLCAFLNRPDHLTRTASELSHWDEIARLAREAQVGSATNITSVNTGATDRIAFLTDHARAQAVVKATLAAVAAAR